MILISKLQGNARRHALDVKETKFNTLRRSKEAKPANVHTSAAKLPNQHVSAAEQRKSTTRTYTDVSPKDSERRCLVARDERRFGEDLG